jgi:anti-sigma regulatory factor (Ser/Thr protein kinase)
MRHETILPRDEAAAAMARAALELQIAQALDGRMDDARLAITELVTNAVHHGRRRTDQDVLRLIIEVEDDRVRVEVEQPGPASGVRVVEPRPDDPDGIGGFGLRLVEELADDWGHAPGPPGVVWAEFRR